MVHRTKGTSGGIAAELGVVAKEIMSVGVEVESYLERPPPTSRFTLPRRPPRASASRRGRGESWDPARGGRSRGEVVVCPGEGGGSGGVGAVAGRGRTGARMSVARTAALAAAWRRRLAACFVSSRMWGVSPGLGGALARSSIQWASSGPASPRWTGGAGARPAPAVASGAGALSGLALAVGL